MPFYDQNTLRTLFIDFADEDWEDQLEAFKETDIEVPGDAHRGRPEVPATSTSRSAAPRLS